MSPPSSDDAYTTQQARKHLLRKAVEFKEADKDGDQEITFEEFVTFILPKTGERSDEELQAWWGLMDIDGDGFLRKDEFFFYALCAASKRTGSGIAAVFSKFDTDNSGALDEIEFEQALQEVGFGDVALDVFDAHAGPDRMISYHELLQAVGKRTELPAMRAFLNALASDSVLAVDTSGWTFSGETPDAVRTALAALLAREGVRLSDLFQQIGGDDFSMTLSEWQDAFGQLGFRGDASIIATVFASLDQDGSGRAGFDEFSAWLYGRKVAESAAAKREAVATGLTLVPQVSKSADDGEEPWTGMRLRAELHDALAAAKLRCVDLLRSWDKNGSGPSKGQGGVSIVEAQRADNLISQKEFLIGMKRLVGGGKEEDGTDHLWYGYVRDAAVSAFARMDRSGDRSISVTEMQHWIDPHMKLLMKQPLPAAVSSPLKRRRSARFLDDPHGDKALADDGLAYSPTRLSMRLAQVRAFEPETLSSQRTRPKMPHTAALNMPNAVRERIWSTRRVESQSKLGPSSRKRL